MFLLWFPPPATGWQAVLEDAESIEVVKIPEGKWVHTAARATVAATSPAPGKEIGGVAMGPWRNWQTDKGSNLAGNQLNWSAGVWVRIPPVPLAVVDDLKPKRKKESESETW